MEIEQYLKIKERRRKNRQDESQAQIGIVAWLRGTHPQILFTTSPAGIKMTIGQAVKMKKMGYTKGTPDLMIFEPRGKYHGIFLEGKTEKGTTSVEQRDFIRKLRERGYRAEEFRSFDEAKNIIANYLMGVA